MSTKVKSFKKRNKDVVVERVPFLTIDSKEFTVPAKVHPIDALKILRQQEEMQPFTWLHYVIEELLGEGSIDALGEAELTSEDWDSITEDLAKLLYGDLNAKK